MFKVNSALSVQLVKIFIMRKIIIILDINQRNLRVDRVNIEKYGKRSVSVPQEMKNVTTLAALKTKI